LIFPELAVAARRLRLTGMSQRFRVLAVAALCGAAMCAAVPAAAEKGGQKNGFVEAPDKLPRLSRADRLNNLDFLFGALKAAPDATSAKAIEERIWAVWIVSPSDTANLLMTRVKTAIETKDLDLAVKLLDAILTIKPDYVEAWNRRATIHYMRKDYNRSLADIRQILAREPRHFGALAGLGLIMQDLGDDKRALDIYRRAIEVHPHLPRIPDLIKTLTEKVEGRDI
jgi:tetratricopeptide (TPR) repeat protein